MMENYGYFFDLFINLSYKYMY